MRILSISDRKPSSEEAASVTSARADLLPIPISVPTPSAEKAPVFSVVLPESPEDKQLRKNSLEITQLKQEVEDLRKTVAKLSAPRPVEAPPSKPVAHAEPPTAQLPTAQLPTAQPERKIAIFTKLWDYLNQVAFETPPNKSDRTS